MKPSIITRVGLIVLLVMTLAAGVLHAQTRLRAVVVGYGAGRASSANNGVALTLQPLVGKTDYGDSRVQFGFWGFLREMVSTGVLDTPTYKNQLSPSAPNPFNPMTTICFSLAQEAQTRIEVYDLRGRRVARLLDETVSAGRHSVDFRPEHLSSGVYLLTLQAGSYNATGRLVLLK